MKNATPEILQKRWMHSHEEDTATEMVFRPASFTFPTSRGRMGFDLGPNQALVEIGIAPADGAQEAAGKWALEDDQLQFFKGSSRKPTRTLQIASADNKRLLVKK